MNISNNTIANLTNGTTNATTASQGYIYGIYPFQAVNTITGNTIHDLTIANANNGTGPVISTGYPPPRFLQAELLRLSITATTRPFLATPCIIYPIHVPILPDMWQGFTIMDNPLVVL